MKHVGYLPRHPCHTSILLIDACAGPQCPRVCRLQSVPAHACGIRTASLVGDSGEAIGEYVCFLSVASFDLKVIVAVVNMYQHKHGRPRQIASKLVRQALALAQATYWNTENHCSCLA